MIYSIRRISYLNIIVCLICCCSTCFTQTIQNENQTSDSNVPSWHLRPCSGLLMGQFVCDKPKIDDYTQAAINCSSNSSVKVACYPNKKIKCEGKTFDGKTIGFYKDTLCRFVTKYHYQTAVLFSIFLGFLGVDRFYLGYVAFGVIKLCTFGLMFIGYLIDMILIITQTLGPSDGSAYIVDYGQLLYPSMVYNNYTFNLTFN